MMPGPPGAAEIERLEADVEEALIALIDRRADDPMIADLQCCKLHLVDEIRRRVICQYRRRMRCRPCRL